MRRRSRPQRLTAALLAAAATLAAGAASAAKPSCAPHASVTVAIAPLELSDQPTKLEHFYPAAARKAQIAGHATLECDAADGRLDKCVVDQETPTGEGFAAGALKIAKILVVRTPPVAQIVRVDVTYDIQAPEGEGCPAAS